MSDSRSLRRALAEMDSDAAQSGCAGFGNRSIHQFWHLFAPHFRGVLLAPRRRPDSGNVTWGWREPAGGKPLTVAELSEVRLRLTNANRSLTNGVAGQSLRSVDTDEVDLDAQVRLRVEKMAAALIAKSDQALAGYVCRTENGTMLHSWGAAKPAQPVFPDTLQGEISGRVLLDGAGVAGLGVVLENPAGLGIAHAKSDATGGFRFQAVSPGRYRLRVADRSDFPADGWPIQMERAALTGLELCGGSAKQAPRANVGYSPPKARRWPAIALVLLVLLGAGAGLWRLKRQKVAPAATDKPASGWQVASGAVAASTGDATSADARRAGGEGGWTDLSRKLPEPKGPKSHQRSPASGGAGLPGEQSPLNESPTSLEAQKGPDRLADADNSTARPVPVRPGQKQPGQSRSLPPARSLERAAAESENEAQGKGEETVAAELENTPSASERSEPVARRPARMGASLTAADTVEREEQTPGTTLQASTTSISTDANTAAKSAANVSAAGRRGVGAANAAPGADATSSTGPQSASGSGPGAAATNHLAANRGARQRERHGATDGDGATIASSVNAASEERAAEPPPAVTEPAKDKAGPEKQRAAKNKAKPVEADPTSAKAASPANVAPEEDEAPETPAAAAAQVSIKPAPARPAPAKVAAVDVEVAGPPPAVVETESGGLKSQGRIRLPAWKTELLRDVILPTLPVVDGQGDSLEELREKSLRTQQARMPQTFREPVTRSGFALEFDPAGEADSPRWRDATGAEPAEATVQGNRAELVWAGQEPSRGQEYVLSQGDGREIARISVDASGAAVLKTERNVRAWFWVGIERAAADRADGAPAARRFKWRHLSGEEIPASWRRDDLWQAGRGQRLDLPLDAGGMTVSHPLALVDRVSGWAMTCEIGGP